MICDGAVVSCFTRRLIQTFIILQTPLQQNPRVSPSNLMNFTLDCSKSVSKSSLSQSGQPHQPANAIKKKNESGMNIKKSIVQKVNNNSIVAHESVDGSKPRQFRQKYVDTTYSRADKDFPRSMHFKLESIMSKMTLKDALVTKYLKILKEQNTQSMTEQNKECIIKKDSYVTIKSLIILDCLVMRHSEHADDFFKAFKFNIQKSQKIQENKIERLGAKGKQLDAEKREKLIDYRQNFHKDCIEMCQFFLKIGEELFSETMKCTAQSIKHYVDLIINFKNIESLESKKEVLGLIRIQERKRLQSTKYLTIVSQQLGFLNGPIPKEYGQAMEVDTQEKVEIDHKMQIQKIQKIQKEDDISDNQQDIDDIE